MKGFYDELYVRIILLIAFNYSLILTTWVSDNHSPVRSTFRSFCSETFVLRSVWLLILIAIDGEAEISHLVFREISLLAKLANGVEIFRDSFLNSTDDMVWVFLRVLFKGMQIFALIKLDGNSYSTENVHFHQLKNSRTLDKPRKKRNTIFNSSCQVMNWQLYPRSSAHFFQIGLINQFGFKQINSDRSSRLFTK